MNHPEQAAAYFCEGFNCAQSLVLTFAPLCGMEPKMALRLTSSFGGGIGRMREVCGAVSGMAMVAGLLYGYTDPKSGDEKAAHYARIQALAGSFRERFGSIICRDLLELQNAETTAIPECRTPEYYKKRPCAKLIAGAAEILESYLKANPIPEKNF